MKSPETIGDEVKRHFFSQGYGTNTFSCRELEGFFVGSKRLLVGDGVVLSGWTAAGSLCRIGQAVGARVIRIRVIVNFANISAGKRGLFSGQNGKAILLRGSATRKWMFIRPPRHGCAHYAAFRLYQGSIKI